MIRNINGRFVVFQDNLGEPVPEMISHCNPYYDYCPSQCHWSLFFIYYELKRLFASAKEDIFCLKVVDEFLMAVVCD